MSLLTEFSALWLRLDSLDRITLFCMAAGVICALCFRPR